VPQKCILIILDGLGDRSYARLKHQTPLQAANTPALDKLAKAGANGIYHAGLLGQALPSENAHFSMFGYEMEEFPGRGPLEALGAGIDLDAKDVAVLAHLASVRITDGYFVLEKGKPQASEDEALALTQAVGEYEKEGVTICFNRTHALYGIIILKGDVSPFVTDTDPIMEGRPIVALKPWHEHARDTATHNTINALKSYLLNAHTCLKKHPINDARIKKGLPPINAVVTQRAGQLKAIQPFTERYGLRGLSIASGIVYQGIGAYLGFDCLKVSDTGNPDDDIADRLDRAHKALHAYDFIHVHTKAPDEAAHTKDPLRKKAVIELVDRGIGRAIEPLINDPKVFIIVMADHSTPSSGPLIHSGEPVPLTFWGAGVRRDTVRRFDEISSANGALGCVRGKELMYLILNHLDRIKLQGLMDTPVDQAFWPGKYEPFRPE